MGRPLDYWPPGKGFGWIDGGSDQIGRNDEGIWPPGVKPWPGP